MSHIESTKSTVHSVYDIVICEVLASLSVLFLTPFIVVYTLFYITLYKHQALAGLEKCMAHMSDKSTPVNPLNACTVYLR